MEAVELVLEAVHADGDFLTRVYGIRLDSGFDSFSVPAFLDSVTSLNEESGRLGR